MQRYGQILQVHVTNLTGLVMWDIHETKNQQDWV